MRPYLLPMSIVVVGLFAVTALAAFVDDDIGTKYLVLIVNGSAIKWEHAYASKKCTQVGNRTVKELRDAGHEAVYTFCVEAP